MKGAKSKAETKKSESKLSVKKNGAGEKPRRGAKSKRAAKDPNKPKRPASAFFVFMEEFRKEFKEKNPNNKSVAAVGKAGGEKWKSMSDAEKAPYVEKAAKRKEEYNDNMTDYNNKQAAGPVQNAGRPAGRKAGPTAAQPAGRAAAAKATEEDDSDNSESEVHDDDDDDAEQGGSSEEESDDSD